MAGEGIAAKALNNLYAADGTVLKLQYNTGD